MALVRANTCNPPAGTGNTWTTSEVSTQLQHLIGPILATGFAKEDLLLLVQEICDQVSTLMCPALPDSTIPGATPATASSIPATPDHFLPRIAPSYACPRCSTKLRRPVLFSRKAELMRHFMHTCEQTTHYKCPEPDCLTRVKREDHVKNHLRKKHGLDDLATEDRFKVAEIETLKHHAVLGCGFCRFSFVDEPKDYGQHIAEHFNQGLAMAEWSTTTHIRSLLLQTNAWYVWMDIINDRLPGLLDPEQYLSFTMQTAAPFIAYLERGCDHTDVRLVLENLFDAGLTRESAPADIVSTSRRITPCVDEIVHSREAQLHASSAPSPPNEPGTPTFSERPEPQMRQYQVNPTSTITIPNTVASTAESRNHDPAAADASESFGMQGPQRNNESSNPDENQRERTDFEYLGTHPQAIRYLEVDEDILMYDAPPTLGPSTMMLNSYNPTPSLEPEFITIVEQGHHRSASDRLKRAWRRSFGA